MDIYGDISQIWNIPLPEILHGTKGNDSIMGFGGKDILYGYSGDDQLVGWWGSNDTLYGGSGADTFHLYVSNSVSLYPSGHNGYYNNQPYVQDNINGNVFILPDLLFLEGDGIVWNSADSQPITVRVYGKNGSLSQEQTIAIGDTTPYSYRQQHNSRPSASIIPIDSITYGNDTTLAFDENLSAAEYLTNLGTQNNFVTDSNLTNFGSSSFI